MYSAVGTFLLHLVTSSSDLSLRLTEPLSKNFGRRGTILFTCLLSILSCLLQAFSPNWYVLVGSRLLLGVGLGLGSATIAIYTSECAPAGLRGVLVCFWQSLIALGILLGFILGYICDVKLKNGLNEIESNIHPHQLLYLNYVSNIMATAGSGLTPRTSYL